MININNMSGLIRVAPIVVVALFGYFFVWGPFQDFLNARDRNSDYAKCFAKLDSAQQRNPQNFCKPGPVPISFYSIMWFLLYAFIFIESVMYLLGKSSLTSWITGGKINVGTQVRYAYDAPSFNKATAGSGLSHASLHQHYGQMKDYGSTFVNGVTVRYRHPK